jgi:hypothetical protein
VKRVAAALAVAAVLATGAACGGGGGGGGGSNGGPDAGQGGNTPSELTGVITEISGAGNAIDGITLRTDDGETHVIALDPAIDYGFPLALLEEYKSTGQRLNVSLERRNNRLYATLILAS